MNKLKKGAVGVTAAGVVLVAMFEGFAPEAMQPLPGDKWTIGFGHTGGVEEGDTITVEEALDLLHKDLAWVEDTINRHVKVPLLQCQYNALASLVYNIGSSAFVSSSLLEALNRFDYAEVDRQWMRWKYFKGKPVKGLENRRAREVAVFHGEPVVKSGDSVCFGSGLCVPYDTLVQERTVGPDGAEAG